jgi:hypothetical protein
MRKFHNTFLPSGLVFQTSGANAVTVSPAKSSWHFSVMNNPAKEMVLFTAPLSEWGHHITALAVDYWID